MLLLVFLLFFGTIILALAGFALYIDDKVLALIIALSSALLYTFSFFRFFDLRKSPSRIKKNDYENTNSDMDDFAIGDKVKVLDYEDPFIEHDLIVKQRNDWFLRLSVLLGFLYLVYLILYFSGVISDARGDLASEIGTALGFYIVLPHLAAVSLAVLFGIVALISKKRWPILTSAILYIVSIVLFPIYFMFVTVQMIFAFISFARKPRI